MEEKEISEERTTENSESSETDETNKTNETEKVKNNLYLEMIRLVNSIQSLSQIELLNTLIKQRELEIKKREWDEKNNIHRKKII